MSMNPYHTLTQHKEMLEWNLHWCYVYLFRIV
jgi:hypothetical protein